MDPFSEKRFNCPHCPSHFSTSSKLQIHLRGHTGERPFDCRSCSRCFSDSTSLNAHVKICNQPNVYPFRCSICSKHYRHPSSLSKHRRSTHSKNHSMNIAIGQLDEDGQILTRINQGEESVPGQLPREDE